MTNCQYLVGLQNRLMQCITAHVFATVGGDDSEEDEEVDSNNDAASMHSERTDKDEEGCEGIRHSGPACISNGLAENGRKSHKACCLERLILIGAVREMF